MSADPVISALRRAVDDAPRDVSARTHLAAALLRNGELDDALDHISHALSLHPASIPTLVIAAAVHRALDHQLQADSYQLIADALGGQDNPRHPTGRGDTRELESCWCSSSARLSETSTDPWATGVNTTDVQFGRLLMPADRLEDVVGLDHAASQLRRMVIDPMRHPDLVALFGGISEGETLLWGPPHCGQVFIAQALAGELEASLYVISLIELLTTVSSFSPSRQAERDAFQSVFHVAARHAPCVVLLQDLDALGRRRFSRHLPEAGSHADVHNLLYHMDTVRAEVPSVVVLGATNHPWDVAPALSGQDRFSRPVLIPPPNRELRSTILADQLAYRPHESVNIDRLTAITDGYSIQELRLLVARASEIAFDRSLALAAVQPITDADLHAAYHTIEPFLPHWLETADAHRSYWQDSPDSEPLDRLIAVHGTPIKRWLPEP